MPTQVSGDGPFTPNHEHHQETPHFPTTQGYACSTRCTVPGSKHPFPFISFHPAPGAVSPLLPYPCQEWGTEWSACSVTCGVGFSTRVSNQNRYCRLETQRRLCMARPCPALPAASPVVSASVKMVPLGNRFH